MTAVGDIIQPGQPIPDDVTGLRSRKGAEFVLNELGHWHMPEWADPRSCVREEFCGYAAADFARYAPLTVTAVREQPAEPERKCPGCGGQPHVGLSCIDAGRARPLVEDGAAEPEPVDVLDLVRQYGDMRFKIGCELDGSSVKDFQADEAKAEALFARIEAEVNRMRAENERLTAEVFIERTAEERGNAELKDIVQRLDEAEVDSGGVSERVGYAIQSMRRGWSTASHLKADLDTVRADRETTRAALQHLKDAVTRPAIKALGVQHNEDIVPAIERLKGDLRAVDDLVQDDLMQQPAPLVLSLPQVPEGAVALVGGKTGQRYERSRPAVVLWMHPREDVLLTLGELLSVEGSVTVVMREPRTWPKLDDAPKDEVRLRGASGAVYQFSHDDEGVPVYRYIDPVDGEEGRAYSFFALQHLDGPLVEVFDDKDGTR